MWFKQVHFLKLNKPIANATDKIVQQMEVLAFKPSLPSMAQSIGWVPPVEETFEEADTQPSLVLNANQCLLLALQVEEKILPASVINHALKEHIKKIETNEARKIRQKEKLSLKDEIVFTLLPRAFSKYSLIYAYVDMINQWLVINTNVEARIEQFVSLFKKTFGDIVEPVEINKPSNLLTYWLREKNYPREFAIEKACVLQDPKQQNRVISAREQDLFASSIQSLVKDGCEVIQLALTWQDRLRFVITDNFSLRSIQLADDDLYEGRDELESRRQRFTADLVMMTKMYAELLNDLIQTFGNKKQLAQTG